jgi:general secretion pathway protein G
MRQCNKQGFTFIELVIVVSIIGILAAIAVPNFLHAQIRARVAGAEAELHLLSLALESYFDDNGFYPGNLFQPEDSQMYNTQLESISLMVLSTPVPYLSRIPGDPFLPNARSSRYSYVLMSESSKPVDMTTMGRSGWGHYVLACWGPDKFLSSDYIINPITFDSPSAFLEYAPTNGITSTGDIILIGPQ